MSEGRASKMFLNLMVLLMLLRFRPAWGSENGTVLATHIYDDEEFKKIHDRFELLMTANENLRLRVENLDHRLTVSSDQSNRINNILNEINRKLPEGHSTNQIEEIARKRLEFLDHRLAEDSKHINSRLTDIPNEINRGVTERLDVTSLRLDERSRGYFVHTPDSLDYQFYPVSGARFTFKVSATNNADLALVPSPQNTVPIYDIIIGGWENTKSAIRYNRNDPYMVEVQTPGILNAGELRGFWIHWFSNIISVGKEGEAYAFMSYEAPDLFDVKFVGIRTIRSCGTWLIPAPNAFGSLQPFV